MGKEKAGLELHNPKEVKPKEGGWYIVHDLEQLKTASDFAVAMYEGEADGNQNWLVQNDLNGGQVERYKNLAWYQNKLLKNVGS